MKRQMGSFFYKPSPRTRQIRGKRWNFPAMVVKIFKRTATVIGGFVLFTIILSFILGLFVSSGTHKPLPQDMILVFNVENGIRESEMAASFIDPFAAQSLTVHQFISVLDKAKDDKRVQGILVSLDSAGIELAHIQELRTAVKSFRESGKYAHIYTASFTDLGSGMGAYYFASAFEQIWMQPVGMLSITGISMEMPYAKNALDKLGVEAQFVQREEYKSAMENFTNDQMSPENREAISSILNEISAMIVNDIAADRRLDQNVVEDLIDKGLLTGPESLKFSLIDRLDYPDVLVDEMRGDKTYDELPLVPVEDYYDSFRKQRPAAGATDIALVNIHGQIVSGSNPEPGFATSDYIADAIHEATDDENIKAIVVRVDSPGGSPSASETIRRAIVRAKEEGKKVIVSMGPVAASGGYWVSVDADRIFALPSTLTGSIGVVMGKFQLGGLWEKLGINWDSVRWGERSDMWSVNEPFDEGDMARINAAIDETYDGFLERVAKGRGMKPEQVREVAKGRAWTGSQAIKNGLVDDIGGLDDALDYAARELGRKDRHDLNVIPLPKPLSPFEQMMMLVNRQASVSEILRLNAGMFAPVMPAIQNMHAIDRMGPFQAYDPRLKTIKN